MSRCTARLLALALAAVALAGCESTQQKSAQLQRAAHRHEHSSRLADVVSIGKSNPHVKIISSVLLTGRQGAAVAVTLENLSASAIAGAPIQIKIAAAHGGTLYSNATPGLAASLITAPLIAPHGKASWVDDQVQISGAPGGVSVRVGEGKTPPRRLPSMQIEGVSRTEGGQGVTGKLRNRSAITQRELVIYGLARRAGKVVAAGRAIVAELPGDSTAAFEIYLIGDASGAQLQLSAPPTTFSAPTSP